DAFGELLALALHRQPRRALRRGGTLGLGERGGQLVQLAAQPADGLGQLLDTALGPLLLPARPLVLPPAGGGLLEQLELVLPAVGPGEEQPRGAVQVLLLEPLRHARPERAVLVEHPPQDLLRAAGEPVELEQRAQGRRRRRGVGRAGVAACTRERQLERLLQEVAGFVDLLSPPWRRARAASWCRRAPRPRRPDAPRPPGRVRSGPPRHPSRTTGRRPTRPPRGAPLAPRP